MGIRTFKPMTPSQRGLVRPDFAEITKTSPEKTLLRPLRKRVEETRGELLPSVTVGVVTSADIVLLTLKEEIRKASQGG